MDEVIISKTITESYMKDLTAAMDVDVAIAGAGPAGLVASYYLAREGIKTALFERQLRVGGGMPGGGMMMSRIVLQEKGKGILDEFGVQTREYREGYYIADSLDMVSTICSGAIKAGAMIFNLISVEDVMIRENDAITGVVLNWSAVSWSKLHVDPLTVRSRKVIDATGHDSEVCHIVTRKIGPRLVTQTGEVIGEKPMWAEVGEERITQNTREVYPGLIVAGMAANAVFGAPRMGAIFGGMLLSGKRAAEMVRGTLMEGGYHVQGAKRGY